ncbi:MAG TPA: endonuclease/exonuclease/phosphatase family protein [Cyclobacteriaceae bacterium]|nr:endonuclease/exonuclease/phosphatase family protein [Cyclobacteriaceae bacterium]
MILCLYKPFPGMFILYSCFLIHAGRHVFSQTVTVNPEGPFVTARVVFYNAENLFHPSDDPDRDDDSFTPGGDHHWTFARYRKKLNDIGRCLAMIGVKTPPAVIGLAEIENGRVLSDLASQTILSQANYGIIHKDSPDRRGIDVGILYDPEIFTPEAYELLSVDTSMYRLFTREMLYVRGLFFGRNTFHLFVVHWPSRRGGQVGSEKNRILTAQILKAKVQVIMKEDSLANILIMGDFNDNPDDKSLREVLNAGKPSGLKDGHSLANLMWELAAKNEGSYIHQHNFLEWDNLDQILVSGSLYTGSSGLKIDEGKAFIFRPSWLIDRDGLRLFPTYRGPRYLGGFSDHLPVYTNIVQY